MIESPAEFPTVRLICTGRGSHKNTMLATCTIHDDHMETTRLHTRHSGNWAKTTITCRRCTRVWQFKDGRLEASVLAAAAGGVSRVDLSKVT